MNHSYNEKDIDDFVKGRLKEAKRIEMLQAMEQDEDLRNEVETMQAADKVLLHLRKEALMEEMSKWNEEEAATERKTTAKIIPLRMRTLLAIAASVAILVAALLWFFGKQEDNPSFVGKPIEQPADTIKTAPENQHQIPNNEEKKEEIAKEEQQKTETKPNPDKRSWLDILLPKSREYAAKGIDDLAGNLSAQQRAVNPNDTSLLEKVTKLYQENRFREIASLKFPPDAPAEAVFIKAIAFFKDKKYAEAARTFDAITGDFSRGYDAEWGEALALSAQLPATCQPLNELLSKIEATASHTHRAKVANLKATISLDKICQR